MKRLPPLLKTLLALSLLLCLVTGCIIAFLQSNWIAFHIRQAVIDGVEDATGARVEIPGFRWNWRALTVEMHGFTMHGFEPSSGPPLFTAPLIRVRLRILLLLEQKVQLSSLIVTRPRFYLMIEPDGKTNIPGPKHIILPKEIINTLIDLRLPHVEATEGWAQINARAFPVSLVGDHVSVLIQFQRAARRYQLALHSPALRLGANDRAAYFDGSVDATGNLWRDHFALIASRFHSRSADLTVSGSLYEFNNPVVDWRMSSTFAATETLRDAGIKGVQGGAMTLNGVGHHDPQNPLFFDGQLSAVQLSLDQSGYTLRNASVKSRLVVDRSSLKLPDLLITSTQGRFSGNAFLESFRDLHLAGTLSGIDLQAVASEAIRKPLPWSATLGGPIDVSATVRPALQDLTIHGTLALQPGTTGIPVSGDLRYAYRPGKSGLVIEDSSLKLPHTQLSVSGQPDANFTFAVDTTDLADLNPGLSLFGIKSASINLPSLARGGSAHAEGIAHLGTAGSTKVDGTIDASRVQWKGAFADSVETAFNASPDQLQLSSFKLESPLLESTVSIQLPLKNWNLALASPLQGSGFFLRADVESLVQLTDPAMAQQIIGGSAAGSFHVRGTLAKPAGDAQVKMTDLKIHGEHLESVGAALVLENHRLTVSRGELQSGNAALSFNATYAFGDSPLQTGKLQVAIDSNRFPLSCFRALTPAFDTLEGQTELHIKAALAIDSGHLTPLTLSGTAGLHRLLYKGAMVGDLDASAVTESQTVKGELTGNVRGSRITGAGSFQLAPGTPASGNISFEPVNLNTLRAILQPAQQSSSLLSGAAGGKLVFDGPLEKPAKLHAILQLQNLQITGPPLRALGEELSKPADAPKMTNELILQSLAPVTIELTEGTAAVRSAEFTGRDTHLNISGTAGLSGTQLVHLGFNGGFDLRLLQLLYPELQIGGQSKLSATVSGTLSDPQLAGAVQLVDGNVSSPLVPNSLSHLNGTLRFDQHRATLEKVTAQTGGGLVQFGGFVTYTPNHPLVYRLDSTGQNIRVRYANGISVTGNSQFSLTGTSEQSLLSGGITVSRVVLNPSADLGNILALTAAPTVASDNSKDYLSRLQLDVHVESSPNLQLDTALSSNVQTELDLQLRGTPKQPVILGSIEANQGDIKVFGSRYTINRGQITFTNAARLEPVLDLDLQTQARGITVDITVSGTLNKLNINYRSDPPLQPRDIIALLTVGRTPQTTSGDSNVSATNDSNSLQAGANSVLGQAIAPVSNRLSKLFGITNIKIDPLVQGITNTPQARLTLEQQISRQITVTYITNLSQTSEQIFRLEYSLNPQFSLIALRDDNGEFGIDILFKKRFK